MAGVRLEAVAKRFGHTVVIDRLDLEVRDREFMVLVGPSGCGKSTALRLVAGLEELSGGRITIGDRVVNGVPPDARDVAMVFQNYALYPHMSVRRNLEFGLQMRGTPPAEIAARVDDAARLLGIEPLLDRRPRFLSGGQRQRVALGRAIVRHPAVFLFDEPLSNLDAKLRLQMRTELKKLQDRLRTTTIYVTHDQVEAMTMGHRIAVLRAGKLQQVGTPAEVYERPANAFVAQFIGTPPMNLLRGRLEAGGTQVRTSVVTLPLRRALAARPPGDGEVLVGIRPEHLLAPGREPRGDVATLEATVELVETLGGELVVHARAGETALAFRQDPRRAPATGERIPVRIELGAVHLFAAGTEERLA